MTNQFEFEVIGVPVAQGSKRVFGRRLVDANDKTLRPWRATVAAAAVDATPDEWNTSGIYTVCAEFWFPRPRSHFGATGVLRPSRAEPRHAQKPDLDKLCRATLDAMTDAGVWRDDAQVSSLDLSKRWTEGARPGLLVTVWSR